MTSNDLLLRDRAAPQLHTADTSGSSCRQPLDCLVMFTHRLSLVGYVLFIISGLGEVVLKVLPLLFTDAWSSVFMNGYNVASISVGLVLNVSSLMIVCGILARGFERVEAAILSRRDF